MRVLALDLATSTGWACGSDLPLPISHGVLKLPKTGDDIGRFLRAFRDWLGNAIQELAPTHIVFEAPILRSATSLATARKLYGLAGMTEVVAGDYQLPALDIGMSQIRKHFIGTSRAPKTLTQPAVRRMWIKQQTVEQCRSRGFRVAGDDDADALALLSYALSLKSPGFVLRQHELRKAAA